MEWCGEMVSWCASVCYSVEVVVARRVVVAMEVMCCVTVVVVW